MTSHADDTAPDGGAAPPSVRAQLLATEHWSLLASRSTTQSEVLTRISMFLTLTSAGLVSLALVGQATDFSGAFPTFAIAVLGIVLLVGILTQMRVTNVSMEDLAYVLAMNRLRAAYTELDPGITPYLMTSRYDDFSGSRQTYYFLGPRGISHIAGSSMVFSMAVNAALVGVLFAGISSNLAASTPLAIGIGALCALIYFGVSLSHGARKYFQFWKSYSPQFPTPSAS
ncbi:MAG: hypothetical protein ABI275_01305 [Terrimesophilobacter sp.]